MAARRAGFPRLLLSVSIALGLLPLSYDLPIWFIGVCLAALALGPLLDNLSRKELSVWFRILLFGFGVGFAMAIRGGEKWMALLAIMLSLKPLEGNSYRHLMSGAIFTCFLLAAGVLFHQELNFGVYVLLAVMFNVFVMLRLNQPSVPVMMQLRFCGRLFLFSLPVAALLFLIFPRLPGPIWGYRLENPAVTGFTDRLTPGEFASLVHDNTAAFRVEFAGTAPSREKLYWRGLVLWQSKGLHWYQGPQMPAPRNSRSKGNNLVEYTVTLEPHFQRWLFGLDLPLSISLPLDFRREHTVAAHRRIRHRLRYSMVSSLNPEPEPLTEWESQLGLQLPDGNPRARELAAGGREAASQPADLVELALEFFRRGEYSYTSTPLQLHAENRVDDFLFRTRQGYCGHYAGAFAFLMRAAGLPARVVTGYLGGEYNTIGEYLLVRQADAHAWTEVWLPGMGWLRLDPTTVISPARLTEGVEAALPPGERYGISGLKHFLGRLPLITGVSMGWDALNNLWDNWVISFTFARQRKLFTVFGLDRSFRHNAVVALVAACSLAVLVALLLQYRPRRLDHTTREPIRQAYRRFCKKLARIGLPREEWQGPRRYTEKIVRSRPDLAVQVNEITRLYETLRFAEKGGVAGARKLRQQVNLFRPRRSARAVKESDAGN